MADQIIQVIEEICEKFGTAVDWSAESLAPVISSLVGKYASYVILSGAVYLFIYALLIFMGCRLVRWMRGKAKEYGGVDDWACDNEGEFSCCLALLAVYAIVMLVYTLGVLFGIIPDVIQAITVPELTFVNKVMTYLN